MPTPRPTPQPIPLPTAQPTHAPTWCQQGELGLTFSAGPTYMPGDGVDFNWETACDFSNGRTFSLYYCRDNSAVGCSATSSSKTDPANSCTLVEGSLTSGSAQWSSGSDVLGYYFGCVEDDKVSGGGVDVQFGGASEAGLETTGRKNQMVDRYLEYFG